MSGVRDWVIRPAAELKDSERNGKGGLSEWTLLMADVFDGADSTAGTRRDPSCDTVVSRIVEVFEDEKKYVAIAVDEWYPEENSVVGAWVGELIGKPYVWKLVSSEWGSLP